MMSRTNASLKSRNPSPSLHPRALAPVTRSRIYFLGNSLNTFLKISRLLYKLLTLSLSLSKCALSLACPQGSCAAGAPNSFSKNLILGIDPPSLIYRGFLPLLAPFVPSTGEEGSGELDKISSGVAASDVWSLPFVRVVVVAGVGLRLGLIVGERSFLTCCLGPGTLERRLSPRGPQTSITAFSSVWKISLSGSPSQASA